jgi:hypothetical protein
MDFIDLKTQQQRIKAQLDANIQKVLAHGSYIETFEQQFILERWIFWEIFLRTHFDSGRSIGQESC